jgi:PEP-CTERM motif-containing protein
LGGLLPTETTTPRAPKLRQSRKTSGGNNHETITPDGGSLNCLNARSQNFSSFSGGISGEIDRGAGSGSNTFQIEETGLQDNLDGSATAAATILTSVPEPSTWAMALIGFAIVGFAAHSRRFARLRRVV